MNYYILYPKNQRDKVSIVTKRPNPKSASKKYGFAEGPLKNQCEVWKRLNWMDIDSSQRPPKFREANVC